MGVDYREPVDFSDEKEMNSLLQEAGVPQLQKHRDRLISLSGKWADGFNVARSELSREMVLTCIEESRSSFR